jgi:hypothetical protein
MSLVSLIGIEKVSCQLALTSEKTLTHRHGGHPQHGTPMLSKPTNRYYKE